MQSMKTFSPNDVSRIAGLAHIPISDEEEETLAKGFTTTLEVVDKLNSVNTKGIDPTCQVTGLTNVTREDIVDEQAMLSQEQALRNAKRTYKGFFVVEQVLEKQ